MISAICWLLAAAGVFLAARALDRYVARMQTDAAIRRAAPLRPTADHEGSVWVPSDDCYCGSLPPGEACDACLAEIGMPPESFERLRASWRATHGRSGGAA